MDHEIAEQAINTAHHYSELLQKSMEQTAQVKKEWSEMLQDALAIIDQYKVSLQESVEIARQACEERDRLLKIFVCGERYYE